jgi:UDP-2,4-diacetamido-2,4,6-trideoxy-beta-L-altropyranose hydrolase
MRCLSIADAAAPTMTSAFAMACSDQNAREIVQQRGHCVIELPDAMEFDSAGLESHLIDSQVVVYDLSHNLDPPRRAALKCYVNKMCKAGTLRMLIDGMPPQAAIEGPDWEVDILVLPYVGALNRVENYETLSGPQFSVLPFKFYTLGSPRQIVDKARKILVTFGGSDPLGLTVLAIDALSTLDLSQVQIRIVIGPGFANYLVDQIKLKTTNSPHIGLILAPDSLAVHMMWADLAISATGLTKYELARTGTPAILVSTDPAHATAHQAFDDANTAWHLGIAEEISEECLSEALWNLITNAKVREKMSNNGQALIDGHGAMRIADYMKRRQHVEHIVSY